MSKYSVGDHILCIRDGYFCSAKIVFATDSFAKAQSVFGPFYFSSEDASIKKLSEVTPDEILKLRNSI